MHTHTHIYYITSLSKRTSLSIDFNHVYIMISCDLTAREHSFDISFLSLDNPEIVLVSVIDGNDIVEHDTATLQCKLESNPLSNVEWTFNNDTVYKDSHGVLQSNYTIQRAKCVDTGFYTCTATNVINMESYSDKRVVQLSVKCKYIMLTFFSSMKHSRKI